MLLLQWLLFLAALALFLAAAVVLVADVVRLARALRAGAPFDRPTLVSYLHWKSVLVLAGAACLPLVAASSIVVVPSGMAAVRVSQVSGTLPGVLYPGVHAVVPFVQRAEMYSIRDSVFSTVAVENPKQPETTLRVQSKEGLPVGLGVTVRYRLDPQRLPYVHASLPQPIHAEIVAPVVASAFREAVPAYMVREVFATRREELRRQAAQVIVRRLGADAILVKEVLLRDVVLPPEYAKGLEGLLLQEQESERLGVELDVKAKLVRAAELEAEADKVRQVKNAEAQAQITVLQAKAQADAMQHTLPLKEKQIQQTRLEAEARKESTVKNAEAQAQAKVIDSRAEMERQGLLAKAEEQRIRLIAGADAERMRGEAQVLHENPMLIQKIIAERLSDKVQIMMVPMDGKFFFANDVLRGTQVGMNVPQPR
jgi:regulator of protease activity HflC (stomatin/prohibitin superfamily)